MPDFKLFIIPHVAILGRWIPASMTGMTGYFSSLGSK
jgi:hypothetical protein